MLETQAGRYTIYAPPAGLPRRKAADHHPLVLWESPAGRVLYVGNAGYAAYAALPEGLRPDVVILGSHVQPEDVETGRTVLLPVSTETIRMPIRRNEAAE